MRHHRSRDFSYLDLEPLVIGVHPTSGPSIYMRLSVPEPKFAPLSGGLPEVLERIVAARFDRAA